MYACLCVLSESGCPLLCVPKCPSCLHTGGFSCPCPHVSPACPIYLDVYMLVPHLTLCVPCFHLIMDSPCSVPGFPAGEHRE